MMDETSWKCRCSETSEFDGLFCISPKSSLGMDTVDSFISLEPLWPSKPSALPVVPSTMIYEPTFDPTMVVIAEGSNGMEPMDSSEDNNGGHVRWMLLIFVTAIGAVAVAMYLGREKWKNRNYSRLCLDDCDETAADELMIETENNTAGTAVEMT